MSSPTILAQANNTTLTNVNVNAVGGNQINNTYQSVRSKYRYETSQYFFVLCTQLMLRFISPADAEKCLKTHNVPGAAYNSSQREHARSCQDGTRRDILQEITKWVDGYRWSPNMLAQWACGVREVRNRAVHCRRMQIQEEARRQFLLLSRRLPSRQYLLDFSLPLHISLPFWCPPPNR
jgi:hypothetical protein